MTVSNLQFLDVVNVVTTSVAGVVGWIVGRRKQKNDFLGELQSSIDMLAEKNKEQMQEILNLRSEVIKLQDENSIIRREQVDEIIKLKGDMIKLQDENSQLRKEVDMLNTKLENLKTTKKTSETK